MNVPCILPAKKGRPPPAKADCVSASGKTRPFAPTVRADFKRAIIFSHLKGLRVSQATALGIPSIIPGQAE